VFLVRWNEMEDVMSLIHFIASVFFYE
jgi:hypothetical protein